jgi:hypothetical protein
MAKTYIKQYVPPSTSETATEDALSVRAMRDLGWGMNNCKAHVVNFKIVSDAYMDPVPSQDVSTDWNLELYLGKYRIPLGYTDARFWAIFKRTQGTEACDWGVLASPTFYIGPRAIDYNLVSPYELGTVSSSSDNYTREIGIVTLPQRDFAGYLWFYLLSHNGDDATRSELYNLDVQPLLAV